MRHELAYILGQIRNPAACPVLAGLLEDTSDDVLVRHEAAEAIGAIGDTSYIPVLEKFCSDPAPEVSETCQLAVDLLSWRKKNGPENGTTGSQSIFNSIDPAPPSEGVSSVGELSDRFLDSSLSLFERYRAMFALRNLNTDSSALALVSGLKDDSALFRHEVAYVLGQMQRSVTVPGLSEILADSKEHRMVRHEAAEALGAIGTEEAIKALEPFKEDPIEVVQQSCGVALDTVDYWNEFSVDKATTKA
jgi:deoxyhypusine monooxygenase